MNASLKELRIQPGRVLSFVQNGEDVIITRNGKPAARIIPYVALQPVANSVKQFETEMPNVNTQESIFGMWQDRTDMLDPSTYVRSLRENRRY